MYTISNEVKALFESEQKQILRITGGVKTPIPNSVGPAAIASFDNAVAADALNVTVDITPVQSGSGDPSPTNVRPISGWTGAKVTRCGENLAEKADNIIGNLSVNVADDGTLTINGTSSTYCYIRGYFNCPDESATYTWALFNPNVVAQGRVEFSVRDRNTSLAGGWDVVNKPYMTKTFVPNSRKKPVYWRFQLSPGITFNNVVFKPMIVLGSIAPEIYKPYAGDTYDIAFPSEAGTVYGGTLDVTTGLLTVTMAEVDLGTLNWAGSQTLWSAAVTLNHTNGTPAICSQYKDVGNVGTSSMTNGQIQTRSNYVFVCDTNHTDATTFKAAMSGVQLVYELANPQTYQLTQTQIALLEGANNVWADCGDVTVEYATGYEYEINITDADVVLDSFSIDRYGCNGTKLEVGTAVASEMSLKLNNADGCYDDVVFEGAELYVEIGIADWTQENPNITYIPCGYFTPDEQPRTRDIITLHALDRMMNFDAIPPQLTPWTDNNGNVMTDNYGNVIYFCADLSLPATVSGLIQQACDICQVPFTQDLSTLPNYNLTISALPALQQDITFRNIIQWCAGIMGTNAWIDWEGKLRFSWYGTSSVYTTTMANRFSSDLSEDDITITGVGFTTGENAVVLSGDPGYIIDMSDNPLAGLVITQALPGIGNVINGFTYRPFTASVFNAPYLWPMDAVTFTDKYGNDHTCALTNVNFGINGATALQSIGESLKTNSGVKPSGLTATQLRVINQLNASLDQEGIFNRLTNNGEVQGLILYDGKVYLNASYINTGFLSAARIKGGTIDGNTVNAKQFQVIDGDDNVVATFDSVITLGQYSDVHSVIDYNSFEIKDANGDTFVVMGDTRNADGYLEVTETITSYSTYGVETRFVISSRDDILSISVNGTPPTSYSLDQNSFPFPRTIVTISPLAANDTVTITYRVTQPVYRFDFGERQYSSITDIGKASVAEGYKTIAKGHYSHAEGVQCSALGWSCHAEGNHTVASYGDGGHAEGSYTTSSGWASHAEGYDTTASAMASHAEGRGTIADQPYQHVSGKYNATDSSAFEIVGNGTDDSHRANLRTLSSSGTEWIAGNYTNSSDKRLKTECGEIPDVSAIKARRFKWNDKKLNHDDKEHIGYFAQDVEAIAPYLVSEDDMGYKSLDYIGFLVAKIASLEKRVAELERRINSCR